MSSNVLNPRKPLIWLLGVAAAAAFFASGALVARATIDDGNPAASNGDGSQKLMMPGIGRDTPASAPNVNAAYGENDVATTNQGGGGTAPGFRGMDTSYPACRAPMPAGVVTASGIDPTKAGFSRSLPSSGFSAVSVSLSSQGECDKQGDATSGTLVLDSSWIHDATKIEAYISQRPSSERVASVLRQDSATVWANGYVFQLSVNAYHIMPAATDAPARDLPATSASGGGAAGVDPARPAIYPGQPTPDPRAAEVLAQLIAQIAPSADQKCFWTVGQGDWSSLGAVGVGDPRPAIPSGFTEQELNVTAFTAPPAGCDTSVAPKEGFTLNAGWQKSGNDFGYIGVSVYSNGYEQDYPGNIGEYGANWSRDGIQFGVYAKSEKPLGIELVRAIARALDPRFNEACFVQERKLGDSDLAGLGFSAAKAPNGYSLSSSNMSAAEIAAGCEKPAGFEPSYNLHWTFEKGADVIDANANRYGTSQKGDGSGSQGPNYLNWTSANGTNFNVNAYSKGVNPSVSKDDLIAVAKSMDPAFDISKLVESPDGGEKPLPIPAEERSARP